MACCILYHGMVCHAVAPRSERIVISGGYLSNLAVQLLMTGSAVIAVCTVLFSLGERPFMIRDWPQQVVARWRVWRRAAADSP